MNSNPTVEKDWKAKYLDSLQQLEGMEQTWSELDSLLRKTISRLSITAKGIDPKLDGVLQDIQSHARNKNDDLLSEDLEKLTHIINQLDDSASVAEVPHHEHPLEARDFSLTLLNELQLDTQTENQLEQLRQSMQDMDNEQCLQEMAKLINQMVHQKPRSMENIKEVLVTLIEKIALSHGNSKKLKSLKRKLKEEYDIKNWHAYLDQIIHEIRVIIRDINHEKIELEGLIVDVTKQLGDISNTLTDEHFDFMQGRKDSQNLQTVMDESVNNIQHHVMNEPDITKLKISISDNLVSIKKGVEDFVTKDIKRLEKSEKRNKKLQMQINYMESESAQLKDKLSENRQKLMYDTLTGVRNRMSYEETLDQEMARWARYHEVFSFAILDIDHFKNINDQFGHNAGDKALQIVARMMTKNIRQTDFLFRIGGEEFVLLLPKTTAENAQPLVEKIRRSVAESSFHFKLKKVDITLSAGLTEITDIDNAESIYERADAAMYQAKQEGRNRLVIRTE